MDYKEKVVALLKDYIDDKIIDVVQYGNIVSVFYKSCFYDVDIKQKTIQVKPYESTLKVLNQRVKEI